MKQAILSEIWDGVKSANQHFMEYFKERDAEKMASLYTEDGQILPPNSPPFFGPYAIQVFWHGAFQRGAKSVLLEIVELEGHGETAIELSHYTVKGSKGVIMDHGKYLVIWKKVEDQWRLHRNIWNSDLPLLRQ